MGWLYDQTLRGRRTLSLTWSENKKTRKQMGGKYRNSVMYILPDTRRYNIIWRPVTVVTYRWWWCRRCAMVGRKQFDDRRGTGRGGGRSVIFSLDRCGESPPQTSRARWTWATGRRNADARTRSAAGFLWATHGGFGSGVKTAAARNRWQPRVLCYGRPSDVAKLCAPPDPFNSFTMPPDERTRAPPPILHMPPIIITTNAI